MKRIIALITLLTCVISSLFAQSNEELLIQLDYAIANKGTYQARRFARADSLYRTARTQEGYERLHTTQLLFDTYLHFQTDSALSALRSIRQLPEYKTDQRLRQWVQLQESQVYGMMGLYSTAFDKMKGVYPDPEDQELRLLYLNARHAVLGWMAEYAENMVPQLSDDFKRQAFAYHDSLIALEPDPLNRSIIQSNYDFERGLYEVVLDTLQRLISICEPTQRIYMYCNLAQAHGRLGHMEEELHFLLLTSIADLEGGVTEYMALPIVASRLHDLGDADRAYNYLYCALEDANLCKANLRAMEVSEVFPIIHEARQQQLAQQQQYVTTSIVILVASAVVLILVVIFLLLLNKKLSYTRIQLAATNEQLRRSNHRLQNEDRSKSEYLKNYLTRCRHYLSTAETFQHQMLNLLQTRQFDELQKQLKSTHLNDEEEQRFYNDFDMVFLDLYPNFVEKLNSLLKPEAQVFPKKGELLTTELRIFALIRMGETDSARIAKFLNYSLTTIYNYRSRIRNNALDKDRFEDQIANL